MVNKSLFNKLNEYFGENIKLSLVSTRSLLIITKDDKVYEFERNKYIGFSRNKDFQNNKSVLIALSDDKEKLDLLITESIVEELCGKQVIDFKNGLSHTIARTEDGKIYCWGSNYVGLLGNGLEDNLYVNDDPIQEEKRYEPEINKYLESEHIIDVRCGENHSLVLTINGDVYAWGWNVSGQIGNGSYDKVLQPYHVKFVEKVKSIECGNTSSMALTESHRAFIWGNEQVDSNRNFFNSPKLIVTDVLFDQINYNFLRIFFLSIDGFIYQINFNDTNPENHSLIPKLLIQSNKFIEIASDRNNTTCAALSESGRYYMWGESLLGVEPRETDFKSFNDIFLKHCKITHKPVKGLLTQFDDDFINDNIFFNYETSFEQIEKLGEGSYGEVFRVSQTHKTSVSYYAVKKMRLKFEKKQDFVKELGTSSIITKAEGKFNSKRLVKYFDVWLEDDPIEKESKFRSLTLYIQMELCDKSLDDFIQIIEKQTHYKRGDTLTSIGYYIASQIFNQILIGVNYLHQLNIIHRDLKPENILLKMESDGSASVKIADFGLVTIHKYAQKIVNRRGNKENQSIDPSHTNDVGTVKYIAPEVGIGTKYDTKADIWSLGAIFNHLFCIFDNCENAETHFESPLLMTKYCEATHLCDRMMSDDPNQRPHCVEIIDQTDFWSLDRIVLTQQLYSKLFDKSTFYDTFNYSLMKLEQVYVLCDCGAEIESNYLIDHQNNCVASLRNNLKRFSDTSHAHIQTIKQMEGELKRARNEFSLFSEWKAINKLEVIETNMSDFMKDRLTLILTDSLNERILDFDKIVAKFCEEFGGNWNIFIGNKLVSNTFDCRIYLSFKIGKFLGIVFMNLKPVKDVLILDKMIKKINNAIKNRACDQQMLDSWLSLYSLTDESFTISERLLDKNIINYFIECNELFANNDKDFCNPAIGVFANISEFSELRNRLMEPKFISIVIGLISNQNHLTSYLSSAFMANILSEGKDFWEINIKQDQNLSFDSMKSKLKSKISELDKNSDSIFKQLSFSSLKPINRLLECNDRIPQEVHYFALWNLYYLINNFSERYHRLLKEDNCIEVLEKLKKCSKTEDYVRILTNRILLKVESYSKLRIAVNALEDMTVSGINLDVLFNLCKNSTD